ncbi:hypothetical protein PI124_g3956 [Phytophthora idaei]|nr:hypothetical protein PI125_g11552 [Phytophthora idaei]KAG3251433.1 hypothetical protein PI124_g3956 [Phytophthora idaei]
MGAGRFLAHIPRQDLYRPGTALARTLAMLKSRLDELYSSYKQTMDRFNIGIISFISEYYSIADQNSDQFSTRCLHTYSGHREHYNPILPSSSPARSFDIQELWASSPSYASRALKATAAAVTRKSSHQDAGKLELGSEGMALFSTLRCMVQEFKNIKLEFTPAEEAPDQCECGNPMQVLAGSSEMICDRCGYLYELKGTVFSDEQLYCQDGTRYKHAGYEPSKHCKC